MVTITVPKKIERILTNGLSQAEVKSRLRVLADTIDSRGWAIKHVTTYGPSPVVMADSDRLIDISSLPQEVPQEEVLSVRDIMDTAQSPIAQQFDTMITQSSRAHHQQLIEQMKNSGSSGATPTTANKWFMSHSTVPLPPAPAVTTVLQSGPIAYTADEAALSAQLKAQASSQQLAYGNLHTLQPLRSGQSVGTSSVPAVGPLDGATKATATPNDPAILSLAKNNDFSIETLARQAKKARDDESSQNEVVISLR